jgi:adenylate cyclase
MYYSARSDLYARKEDLHRRLDALRKAGMPEWPLGFHGDPKQRLTGAELRGLISGKTWSGTDASRRIKFVADFGEDGNVVFAAATTLMTGTATVNNDELCERFDLFLLGKAGCGPIYRNPGGASEDQNEYVYVNPTTVRYFSVAE